MTDRSKRGIRNANMRVRLAIAAAVIVSGGAASVVAVAAGHHGATAAASTADAMGYRHTISESKALTEGFGEWTATPARSLITLAEMTPVSSFAQVRAHGRTLAVQRGLVVLATRKFLVVRSANGDLRLWWLSKGTHVLDVGATASGMAAMTGSNPAAATALATGDMRPAATVMAGSASAVTQLATTTARPATITIDSGGAVITITIARATATVTQPAQMTMTRLTTGTQWAFRSAMGLRRGDLVFVAGTREHGQLQARIVLFAAPGTLMPAPSMAPAPAATPSAGATVFGKHS